MSKGILSILMVGLLALTTTCTPKSDFPECDSSFPGCDQFTATILNLYSLQQDKQLGLQVVNQIAQNPSQFPILDRAAYPRAYALVEGMRDRILNGGKVTNRAAFDWEIRIINDPNTLNAFCTPGGYIYVYTGLIKYLDREDDLAGVMGHEIAHADLRHSMRQILQDNASRTLIDAVLGGGASESQLIQLGQQLIGLSFSRCSEEQADAISVDYLTPTTYNCKGTASFFAKLQASGGGSSGPAFLSTHPLPATRVDNINGRADCIKCNTTPITGGEFAAVKASLP